MKIILAISSKSPFPCNAFNFEPISSQYVQTKLENLNNKKSPGYDAIPPKMLNKGASILCESLFLIINKSLASSDFPDLLKYADVSPLFKKVDNLKKGNYRPVSVLT